MNFSLDIEAAIVYFDAFMYGPLQSRARLFRRRGLKPHSNPNQQRFRKSVPFRWVIDHAELVLRIEHGEVTFETGASQAR